MYNVLETLKQRPEGIPEHWIIFNAPRPIYGTKGWEGEWINGCWYAAIDPKDPFAEMWAYENGRLHATILVFITREDMVKAVKRDFEEQCVPPNQYEMYIEDDILLRQVYMHENYQVEDWKTLAKLATN